MGARMPFNKICLRLSFEWHCRCVTLGRIRTHSVVYAIWHGLTAKHIERMTTTTTTTIPPLRLLLDFTWFRISDDPIICCASAPRHSVRGQVAILCSKRIDVDYTQVRCWDNCIQYQIQYEIVNACAKWAIFLSSASSSPLPFVDDSEMKFIRAIHW